jgi:hypothetical protein
MSISQDEARESLDRVADASGRTRKLLAYARVDKHLVVWGIVWFLGFASDQFYPYACMWIWLALVAVGIACSAVIGMNEPVKGGAGRRLGLLWLFLLGYAGLWAWLLSPFVAAQGQEQSLALWRHVTAIGVTVPMLAYVVIGLWLESFLIWVGLAVTALTVLGLFLTPGYFFLWLAVTGGGTLLGTGLFIHNRWR